MRRFASVASVLAFAAAVSCGGSQAPSPLGTTEADITEADLRQRLFLIADDSMQGRESGSAGNHKTAAYVAAEFKRLGLEPAGDNGTYFQTVPFFSAAADPASRLVAGGTALTLGRDFVPAVFPAPPGALRATPTVFGGPITDSTRWIAPSAAQGKVVVLDLPPGATMRQSQYSAARWRGASAIAIVVLDQIAPEFLAVIMSGRPVPDTSRNRALIPTVWLSRTAAATVLGADPGTLAPGAGGRALDGNFDYRRDPVAYPARNVVAILRGSDPVLRNEYVALTAHNDHVGFDRAPVDHDSLRAYNRVMRPMGADSPIRPPSTAEWGRIRTLLDSLRKVNTPRLDSIRNGADDDGSGTVAILEIAEAMARGGARPRRSILFVNHVGEEAGLLGSNWYTDHATVPIDAIVAEIDQDMTGRGRTDDFPRGGTGAGSPTYLEVVGARRLSKEFGDTLEAANARQPVPFVFDYTFDAPNHPLQYYCRADHYNYARYGIPAVAFSRGEHLDYHQVTDEAQYISYPDLARVTRMVRDAALAIANMSHRPALSAPKPADPHGLCRQ
ncbi:MAG: M20/M25/M40 family metallo-hydrolase [Gemmatimonadetes bacterium]|nr:M20/M25/M40 family metallo-hydrolase [Gemmatimonadota bacterium]